MTSTMKDIIIAVEGCSSSGWTTRRYSFQPVLHSVVRSGRAHRSIASDQFKLFFLLDRWLCGSSYLRLLLAHLPFCTLLGLLDNLYATSWEVPLFRFCCLCCLARLWCLRRSHREWRLNIYSFRPPWILPPRIERALECRRLNVECSIHQISACIILDSPPFRSPLLVIQVIVFFEQHLVCRYAEGIIADSKQVSLSPMTRHYGYCSFGLAIASDGNYRISVMRWLGDY